MGEVKSFLEACEKRREGVETSGAAKCMACDHEWTAITHSATPDYLECPKCHLMRGLFLFPFVKVGAEHWTCHCENDLFHITKQGAYCPNCGSWQKW